ncbi:MAG TPA: HAD-IA family hydrolase [Candidatus Portnoybacteria bacterium]|nr:HAD-IA family hydrolase [Candidatus Portnoybacteria bacterium]
MKNKNFVLFDFDGVIVDSFKTAYEVNKALHEGGDFLEEDYRRLFEKNIFDGKHAEKAKQFFELYIPGFLALEPIKGVKEALGELAKEYSLIIISSTISSPINSWVEKHEIGKYFIEIMGADVHTSKVEKMKMVFAKYNVQPDDCVFITDTLGDLREADTLGVKSLAATYGFHSEATLAKGNPAGFIKNPEEIISEVKKYWNKK